MRFICCILLFALIFVFLGCATFSYDKAIPKKEQSILRIPDELTVVKFNETKVKWKTSSWGINFKQKERFATVKIPAGEFSLVANYYRQNTDGMYRFTRAAKGMELTYNFLPGETYTLVPFISGDIIMITIRRH